MWTGAVIEVTLDPRRQMDKLRTAFGFFPHTPIRHWIRLASYFAGWGCFRAFGLRLFRQRILCFRDFSVCVDVEGLGGLVFLHEIIVKGVYDFNRSPAVERVIFDAGANCGFFALSRCAKNGSARAYCFEPHPETFSRLQRNIALNSMGDRITAVQAAAGASSGHCVLQLAPDSSMGVVAPSAGAPPAAASSVRVDLVSLDDFAASAKVYPDLLKIDVEGFEIEVLKGAGKCLAAAQSVILECHSDSLTRDCLAILDVAGFKSIIRGALVFGRKA